jgi:hypothetical protein
MPTEMGDPQRWTMKKIMEDTKAAAAIGEQGKIDATPAKAKRNVTAATRAKLAESMTAFWVKRRGAAPAQANTSPALVQTASNPNLALESPTRSPIDEKLRLESNQADIKVGREEAASSPVGSHARPEPAAKTSVQFMITGAVQVKLRNLGLSQGTIDKMTPAEAHAMLAASSGMTSKEAKLGGNFAINSRVSTPENQVAGVADDSVPQEISARPVSPKTLKANRKDSKRSTGPTSVAGKKMSSQNSYKHGFFARRLFPSAQQWADDGKDYQALAVAIHEHYQPIGSWEMFWAEKIVTEALRHARSIAYQQPLLGSNYRFWGTDLNTAQRHESAAFKHMLQAIKMLESIQEARKANSGLVQPITSYREQVSEASDGPATVTQESSETVDGCADKTEQLTDSSGSEDVVVGGTDDEQDGSGFLYQGPSDQVAVSSDGQGPENDVTQQTTKVCETNPDASQSQPAEGAARRAANVPQTPLADNLRLWMEREGMLTSEPLPSFAQTKNEGTKPNSAPARELTQPHIKEDSGE